MLSSIITFSIKNKLIVALFTFGLIFYGAYQITQLPIDAVPDITDNQVQIITQAPSFGATDIERLVTFPIEQANSNIAGIKEIRSFSRFGLSLVTIVFDDDIDIYWARQQVAERLQQAQAQIPAGIGTPELGPISTGLGEIYQYIIKPKKGFERQYDAIALRSIQDHIVRRQLLGVQGVAEVSSFGGKLKQYEVAINSNKLNAFGITINQIFEALEKNNQNTGGAYIEKKNTVLYIRTEGLIQNIEDIQNIAIPQPNATSPLFIRDIADVQIGYATRYGALCYNTEGEVAGAVVMMLKGENSSAVIKNIKNRIEQIKKTLPEGIEIEPFLDRTKMVNNAIGTVTKNLLEGALIVIFVLVLFLGNFRAGFLVASVIPLAMLFAICMMNLFGVSGNLMSLGALDFGLIVDGAVIIVEAVMHQMAVKNKLKLSANNAQNADDLVQNTATKMMNSAVFGQIIILIVYLPIFSLQGIEGKMFKPMAQTVAFALLGAFILSLTYIPMMSALLLTKNKPHTKNISDKMMDFLEKNYQRTLMKVLNYQKIVMVFVLILFMITIVAMLNLGGEFIPELEEGDFAVETRVLPGSNLNVSVQAAKDAAKILLKFPEVEKIVSKIGSGEVPTDPMPIEAQDLMIILKNKSDWTTADSFDELADTMTRALQGVTGVAFDFQYPVQMRFNELMTGAKQDVVCKVFGENLDTLTKYADLLGKQVSKVNGAESPYIETITGIPEVLIVYDRPMIAQYGLSIFDVNKIINTAFAGQSTGLIFEDEKRFDLVVRLANDQRKSIENVKNILISTPNGTQISLSQVAKVEVKSGPNQIQREDAKRRIIVGFNIKNRDVQSIVEELQQKVNDNIKLPTGYFVTYGGAFENLNEAKNRLMIAVPVSLLLIFILLFFAFNSIKQSLLIYTAIPLSAIGGVLFLAVRGLPFSISAGVGFIALFGVAVLNGIVLIAEFNRLKAEETGENYNDNSSKLNYEKIKKRVIVGTKLRLRPVLMTAFVASLGFLPMAFSDGSGAEVQRPLATVVIGGLLVATFLTLFVLPILYLFFETNTVIKPKINMKNIVVLMLFLGLSNGVFAQQKINITQATQIAHANNLTLKNEKLHTEYLEKMTTTAYDIPITNIGSELGQFNSNMFDMKIGVSQSIKFPVVYRRQKELLVAQAGQGLWHEAIKKNDLNNEVAKIFYGMIFLEEKLKLLQQSEIIYTKFLEKATLRLQKGETNVLEKLTAENQLGQLKIQLDALQNDYEILQIHLKYLLNTNENYAPSAESYKLNFIPTNDTTFLGIKPEIRLIEQEKSINITHIAIEKTKRKPELLGGVYYQSFRANNIGQNGYNGLYGALGLGVPLFNAASKNKIKALETQKLSIENEIIIKKQELRNEYTQALKNYQKNLTIANYYEKEALKNAETITKITNLQFVNGEINYLDFVQLTNQAIAIKNGYLDAIKALNDSVIHLKFITLQ